MVGFNFGYVGQRFDLHQWSRIIHPFDTQVTGLPFWVFAATCVIAILREPASFLRSLHLQNLQSHYEDQKDLRRALDLEPERREGRSVPRRSQWPQVLLYSEHVRYTEQLRRYDDVFPAVAVEVGDADLKAAAGEQ